MRWQRGDLSFIFNGDNNHTPHTLSMVLLDNQSREFQHLRLLGTVRGGEGREVGSVGGGVDCVREREEGKPKEGGDSLVPDSLSL